MTQYNRFNVKLSNSQLTKLKSAITERQISSTRKAFANNL